MKVDFRHIEAVTGFDGNVSIIDVSEVVSEDEYRAMESGGTLEPKSVYMVKE